jgi:hypothetical protein
MTGLIKWTLISVAELWDHQAYSSFLELCDQIFCLLNSSEPGCLSIMSDEIHLLINCNDHLLAVNCILQVVSIIGNFASYQDYHRMLNNQLNLSSNWCFK